MVQIINRPNAGYDIGSSFGAGIGSGLAELAKNKLNKVTQREEATEKAKGLKQIFPHLNNEQAFELALTPDPILREYVKSELQRPGQEAYAKALGFGGQEGGEEEAVQEQAPEHPEEVFQQKTTKNGTIPGIPKPPKPGPLITPEQQEKLNKRQAAGLKVPGRLTERQATQLAKLKLGERKEERAERTENRKARESAYKSNEPFITASFDKAQTARKRLDTLKEMDAVEGDLDTPGYISFLQNAGLDIPALTNPESQFFTKSRQEFLGDLKDQTRGAITNLEVEEYLKGIPSLLNSPEGRKVVSAGLKKRYQIDIAYNDAVKKVIKESGDQPLDPLTLREKVDEKVGGELEKIGKEFKKEIKKAKQLTGQNKLVTSAQSIAGKVAGRVPRAIAGAGLGALGGSAIGGIGAVPGAIAGGLAGLAGLGIKDVL